MWRKHWEGSSFVTRSLGTGQTQALGSLFSTQMDGHDTEDTRQRPDDMTAFVQNLLQQMVPDDVKLHHLKVDEMGSRINELEQIINELKAEMGMEGSPSPSVPTREKSPLKEFNLKEENN